MNAAITDLNPYLPRRYARLIVPTPKQAAFLYCDSLEALFIGGAGAGKTLAAVLAALQFCELPGYNVLILRRRLRDHFKAGSPLSQIRELLARTDARWNAEELTWKFPSGSSIAFDGLENDESRYAFAGFEFQMLLFDELDQFTETQYDYLLTRARKRAAGSQARLPIRIRATGNPPTSRAGEWIRSRFLEGESDAVVIQATYRDNPHLDPSYLRSLEAIRDPILRAQMLDGNLEIRPSGAILKPEWFTSTPLRPVNSRAARGWDLASDSRRKDADYTVGVRVEGPTSEGVFVVTDIVRGRFSPASVESLLRRTSQADGAQVMQALEQEPGASGASWAGHLKKNVFAPGVRVTIYPSQGGGKVLRASALIALAESLKVQLSATLPPEIARVLKDEAATFGSKGAHGIHDDTIDALALAIRHLLSRKKVAWGLW